MPLRIALLVAALAVAHAADAPPLDPQAIGAQTAATPWRFDRAAATVEASLALVAAPYTARHEQGADGREVTTIAAGGRDRFSWVGWSGTVFRIVGDRLVAAIAAQGSQGGMVIAADLRTGTLLWADRLVGLPPVSHSKYSNRLNIEADERLVTIFGEESAGRYVEVKSMAWGNTIAVHRYDEAKAP